MKAVFVGRGPKPWRIFSSTVSVSADFVVPVTLAILLASAAVAAAAEMELRLDLGEAMALAAKNAAQVQSAQHESLAAQHGLRAARTAWFPELSVTGNAINFHPEKSIGLGPLQVEPDWHSIYVANFSLRYPLYAGGKRVNDVRRGREEADAASARLEAVRFESAYNCRRAYIGLLVADRMVLSAEASLLRVDVIRQNIHNLFTDGLADSVDLLEAELSVRQVKRKLEQARADRSNASAQLARLLGVGANRLIVPTETIPAPGPDSDARLSGPDVPAERFELTALDHQIKAVQYQRSIVKGTYFPAVNGMGGYAAVRPDIGQGDVDWKYNWYVGLTLSWDLNLGGKESAQSGQVLEQKRSLEMKRKDVEESFVLQVQIAWNDVQEAAVVYEISGEEVAIARRRFALAEGKLKAGQITVNRLVELEAELTETEQLFEAARLRYFAAVTDYLYATGSDALWEGM